ncbi:MAG: RIP metalloprotease [Caulobacteraceae bacterium]|nr:RIP metalloprotease [Caulobacteraceae bacterium]
MMGAATSLAFMIPSFLVVITIVVTLHELGHFWAAKLCRIKIDTFSIGFGPTLFSRVDKAGVEWRVAALPLGGYVKFAGDANAASVPDQEDLDELREEIIAEEGAAAVNDYFHFKPVWQRAFVTVAGPLMNFVLSITIFSLLYLTLGDVIVPPRVAGVDKGSAAAVAGFKPRDLIVSADGAPVESYQDVMTYIVVRSGDPIDFVVERDGKPMHIVATPRRTRDKDPTGSEIEVGRLGLFFDSSPQAQVVRHYNPLQAVRAGFDQTFEVLDVSLHYIGRVLTGRESGDQLGGPLGIARAAGAVSEQAAQIQGSFWLKAANVVLQLVQMVAFLSVGIGFLNLLPIPVLDGGHLLFYGYEAVARRPLDAKIQAAGFQVGLALLLGLMLFVTWNDLKKLPLFQHMGGLFS